MDSLKMSVIQGNFISVLRKANLNGVPMRFVILPRPSAPDPNPRMAIARLPCSLRLSGFPYLRTSLDQALGQFAKC